jgi:hypothetical protein
MCNTEGQTTADMDGNHAGTPFVQLTYANQIYKENYANKCRHKNISTEPKSNHFVSNTHTCTHTHIHMHTHTYTHAHPLSPFFTMLPLGHPSKSSFRVTSALSEAFPCCRPLKQPFPDSQGRVSQGHLWCVAPCRLLLESELALQSHAHTSTGESVPRLNVNKAHSAL